MFPNGNRVVVCRHSTFITIQKDPIHTPPTLASRMLTYLGSNTGGKRGLEGTGKSQKRSKENDNAVHGRKQETREGFFIMPNSQ